MACRTRQAHDHCQAEAANLNVHPSSMQFEYRRSLHAARACAQVLLLVATSTTLNAQLPGLPVLQNAFGNRALTGAVNGGWSGEGWAAAGVIGLGTPARKFALAGGLGAFMPDRAGARTAWGVRLSATPFTFASGAFGLGAFVGYGGAGGGHIPPGPEPGDTTMSEPPTRLPLGISFGYQQLFGSFGFSVYSSPYYVWYNKGGGGSNVGVFRVPVGLDIGIAQSFGITLGAEFGADAVHGSLGPRGASYAAGLSYMLKRR